MVDTKWYNLGPEIEFLSYANEDEWHRLREGGIGGSDAGAVLGLNKHTSPLKLYKSKLKEYVEDMSDNIFIKKGKDLESLIFEKYVSPDIDRMGYVAVHPEHVFINPQFPWLRANCDGLAVPKENLGDPSKNFIIEIKWVSEWADVNWDSEEYFGIPASYYAQVQHYMIVTGARKAYLYALFDKDWSIRKYEIPFDTSFAVKLIAKTKEFFVNLQNKIPPAVEASRDKEFLPEYISAMPTETKVSEELSTLIGNYLALKKDVEALEKEVDKLYDEIMERYFKGERPNTHFKMSVSECSRAGLDSKRLAAEQPDVYEQYKTVSSYTRTSIKASK